MHGSPIALSHPNYFVQGSRTLLKKDGDQLSKKSANRSLPLLDQSIFIDGNNIDVYNPPDWANAENEAHHYNIMVNRAFEAACRDFLATNTRLLLEG